MRDSREKRFVPDLFSVSANQCVTELGVTGGGVSAFPEKSVTKVYGSTLLALRGGGWGSNSQEKALLNTSMAPMSEH